jgi:iron(III) transport system permease protein
VAFSLAVGVLSTAIATAFAWTTVRTRIAGARIRETLGLGSLFVPAFVTAVGWVWPAAPDTGLINRALQSAGVPGRLQPDILTTGGMIFVLVTHQVPYAYLFVSAAVRRIDSRTEEASLLCGRGSLYTTLRISLPLLRASPLSSMPFTHRRPAPVEHVLHWSTWRRRRQHHARISHYKQRGHSP